ncbi:MAG: hypothetical protein FWD53_07190, partial [Phycisphaerales bacterium]|nr:hypothetical protein [Phycisphaerales bacterium]
MNVLVPTLTLTLLVLIPALAVLAALPPSPEAPDRVNDSTIKIKSEADIQRIRAQLIRGIWGKEGWPTKKMPEVKLNVPCPIKALKNFSRCDAFAVSVKINNTVSNTSHAWHLLPKVESNRRLVIFNPGHVMDFNDPQYPCDARTIDALLANGYSVLAMLMPLDGLGKVCPHDNLFKYQYTDGTAFKVFFEPIAASLNYLRTQSAKDAFPSYTDFNMVGLSG